MGWRLHERRRPQVNHTVGGCPNSRRSRGWPPPPPVNGPGAFSGAPPATTWAISPTQGGYFSCWVRGRLGDLARIWYAPTSCQGQCQQAHARVWRAHLDAGAPASQRTCASAPETAMIRTVDRRVAGGFPGGGPDTATSPCPHDSSRLRAAWVRPAPRRQAAGGCHCFPQPRVAICAYGAPPGQGYTSRYNSHPDRLYAQVLQPVVIDIDRDFFSRSAGQMDREATEADSYLGSFCFLSWLSGLVLDPGSPVAGPSWVHASAMQKRLPLPPAWDICSIFSSCPSAHQDSCRLCIRWDHARCWLHVLRPPYLGRGLSCDLVCGWVVAVPFQGVQSMRNNVPSDN